MSPLSAAVEAAGVSGVARKRVPSRLSQADFFTESDRARALFARLINAPDPSRIAIIPSASYGLAIAARNLPVADGQNIVVTHEQFPANVHAWRKIGHWRVRWNCARCSRPRAPRGEDEAGTHGCWTPSTNGPPSSRWATCTGPTARNSTSRRWGHAPARWAPRS